jgi:hypothetical protein
MGTPDRSKDDTTDKKKVTARSTSIIRLLSATELVPLEEMQTVQPVETVDEILKLYNTIKAHLLVLIQDEVSTHTIHPAVLKFSSELRKLLEMLFMFQMKLGQAKDGKDTPKAQEMMNFLAGHLIDEDKERILSRLREEIRVIDVTEEESKQNGAENSSNRGKSSKT